MIFAPITSQPCYAHRRRIRSFIDRQFFIRSAVGEKLLHREFLELRNNLCFRFAFAQSLPHPIRPTEQSLFQRFEARCWIVDSSEMRDVERVGVEGADFVKRILPGFQVNIRRRKWRDHRSSVNTNTRDIAGENGPFGLQPIGIVMLSVTWSVKDAKVTGTESELCAVLHR